MNTIGENILLFRIAKGFSKEFLAAKVNSSQDYIHKIESGQTKPEIETLTKIAECLNVSLNLLQTKRQSDLTFKGNIFQAKQLEISNEQYIQLRKELEELKQILAAISKK